MKRPTRIIALGSVSLGVLAMQACSGDSSNGDAGADAANDTTQDVAKQDAANDVSNDVSNDASDGSCPSSWTALPDADPSIAVPDGGGGVLIHASASGTQDYTCEATTTDAGSGYAWVFVGPEATLDDCSQNLIGHHFASDAGATRPEWQTLDNSYIVGKKLGAGFIPDGGASSVPWLLIQTVNTGGSGKITNTLYVQRLFTSGGNAPSTTCDSGSVGTTVKQPYTADYYFYGN